MNRYEAVMVTWPHPDTQKPPLCRNGTQMLADNTRQRGWKVSSVFGDSYYPLHWNQIPVGPDSIILLCMRHTGGWPVIRARPSSAFFPRFDLTPPPVFDRDQICWGYGQVFIHSFIHLFGAWMWAQEVRVCSFISPQVTERWRFSVHQSAERWVTVTQSTRVPLIN